MPCSYSYLQENFYKRYDGVVSITVVLKESDNKVEGSSHSKTFFLYLFIFLLSQICRKLFVIYMFAEKKTCIDVLCTCKATSLSKMAKLVWRYSNDARAAII